MVFLLTFTSVGHLIEQNASSTWPTTQAMVVESSVKAQWGRAGPRLAFRYRFEVKGKEYYGSRRRAIAIVFIHLTPTAREFARNHPVGSEISIAYDPRDPNRSMMYPGLSFTIWAPPVLAIGAFSYASVRAWMEIMRRWLEEEDPEEDA